jgi:hypothetical protein
MNPGKINTMSVTDAYEDGHGRLVVKLGGVLPVTKITGPEADRAELQRYLADIVFCPPMLLNHSSLEYAAAGPSALRIRDREDPVGAAVELDLSQEGCPLLVRAERPRIIGKQTVSTPWSAAGTDFCEREGLRVPKRLEASWHLSDGVFTYFRCEVVSFAVIRS